jgi:hypothetical protein
MRWAIAVGLAVVFAAVAHASGPSIAFDAENPALGYWLGQAHTTKGDVFIALDVTRNAQTPLKPPLSGEPPRVRRSAIEDIHRAKCAHTLFQERCMAAARAAKHGGQL